MIRHIKKSKYTKIVASYLAIQLVVTTIQPSQLWALTSGPSQPEFNSFTPIGTSDMVNLSTGDFNYNIPIMDVGGYPLNLAYDSGITMDQEASWVGLGWNLNVGQIARDVRGVPDDFKGDEIRYENEMRDNVTIGANFKAKLSFFGKDKKNANNKDKVKRDLGAAIGLGIQYNNYNGITFRPTFGTSYDINDDLTVGVDITSSKAEGASVNPSFSLSKRKEIKKLDLITEVSGSFGIGLNSRKGLENMSLSSSYNRVRKISYLSPGKQGFEVKSTERQLKSGSGGFGVSFNDQTNFTPQKRAGLTNDSFTFTGSFGTTFFGVQGQVQVTGYGNYQKISPNEKDKYVSAFGYEHTDLADNTSILDFNREKQKTFNEFTKILPVTNYSYDLYNIQGQGINGMYRPHRSQVGYVYDTKVTDIGGGDTFGGEIGGGNSFYAGAEIKISSSTSVTKKWETGNNALSKFEESTFSPNYIREKVFFRSIGDIGVDKESVSRNDTNLYDKIHGESPINLQLTGNDVNKKVQPVYKKKNVQNGVATYTPVNIENKISRQKRYLRNQSIEMVTLEDAKKDPQIEENTQDIESFAKPHHTVAAKIMKPDGSTYVYGNAAYNTTKVEATFDVSGRSDTGSTSTGLVNYHPNLRSNTTNNSDRFLNRITTPAYAHTYLLSSVLSSDYEDLTEDGPTDDDLGAYTKFTYDVVNDYKWRVPYEANKASYNEGLKTNPDDETGNYIYGEKQLKYVSKIETKTHVAIFERSDRKDALGVKDIDGGKGNSSQKMQKLDKIYLFSKPEYKELIKDNSFETIDYQTKAKNAIKIAHFDYNYSLCKSLTGVLPNYDGPDSEGDNNENLGGKLTLDKVYFTYRGSNMGKFTPYTFKYHKEYVDEDGNPKPFSYNLKGNDIWGNYKPNDYESDDLDNDEPSAPEFPFVEQNKSTADIYTRAWTIDEIHLPSGGKMKIETESDDYQYVQELKAMRMFKVIGAGDEVDQSEINDLNRNALYNGSSHNKYLYVKLPEDSGLDYNQPDEILKQEFKTKYLGDHFDKPIHFRFLLNMTNRSEHYDYVEGYFLIDNNIDNDPNTFDGAVFDIDGVHYASIPMQTLRMNGSAFINNTQPVNPISKAGWHFGRTYLNKAVYSKTGAITSKKFGDIVNELIDSMEAISEIFLGPNKRLEDNGCAREFKPKRSWIRLLNPTGAKLGGGLRVKSVKLMDQWAEMLSNTEIDRYAQQYGQIYEYKNDDGTSSGVATFEPNSSKENPYVEPIYDREGSSYRDKLVSPSNFNYIEKPMGETFFPSANITYGKVKVSNLPRKETDREVKTNATGYVITEFNTCKDFPTIADYTEINNHFYPSPKILQVLNFSQTNTLTLSQGFVVITNDMNGKIKEQAVYAEGKDEPISKVIYTYNVSQTDPKRLDNNLTTINEKGEIEKQIIGQTYDVVNDFIESSTNTTVGGVNANLTGFFAFIPGIVPLPLPNLATHKTTLKAAITTKVIHKMGLLVKKEAYDLGAKVSTENLAWDANTGQLLLTETINEYDNHYYNFNYPAYWYYEGMGLASNNLGLEGTFNFSENKEEFDVSFTNSNGIVNGPLPFYPGDMLHTFYANADEEDELTRQVQEETLWIAEVVGSRVKLMDINGNIINHECSPFVKSDEVTFKIIRSGYKNTQMASMASVTSQTNPIEGLVDGETINMTANKVVNASAVMYNDYWKPQDQLGLPRLTPDATLEYNKAIDKTISSTPNIEVHNYGFNPFLYNARGEWRAVESYAYLTGRNSNITDLDKPDLTNDGFFTRFNPFYEYINDSWEIKGSLWTSASKVTEYSPYGAELENKDALDRYSSAQYGYAYTLPTAVASNNKYNEIGFDGFEDYSYGPNLENLPSAVVDGSDLDEDGNGAPFKREHFNFKKLTEDTNGSGEIVKGISHTGQHSYKVIGARASITRALEPNNHDFKRFDCYENDEQAFDANLSDISITSSEEGVEDVSAPNNTDRNFRIRRNYSTIITGIPDQKITVFVQSKTSSSFNHGANNPPLPSLTGSNVVTVNGVPSFPFVITGGANIDTNETNSAEIILNQQGQAVINIDFDYYQTIPETVIGSFGLHNISTDISLSFYDDLGRELNSDIGFSHIGSSVAKLSNHMLVYTLSSVYAYGSILPALNNL